MKLEPAFKQRCEAIAVDWRHRLGLAVIDPLPAETLLRALDPQVTICAPADLPNLAANTAAYLAQAVDWSAGILRRDPLLILLHPAHSGARRESDLMHEAGHVLLDHPQVGFSAATGLPLRDPRHEAEATYLGACLQIPRQGLRWLIRQNATNPQIAAHFGASEQMVAFRRNLTGQR